MTGSSGLPGRGASTQPAWYEAYPQSYRGHQGRVCAVCISCPAIVSPPAPLPGPAPCAEHACLANRLRQVQWSPHDDWLLSVGGSDCSLFQWRHIRPAWLRWWLRRTTPEREHLTATFGRTRPSIRPEYRLEGRVQVVAAGDLTGAEVQHRASKSEDQMTVEVPAFRPTPARKGRRAAHTSAGGRSDSSTPAKRHCAATRRSGARPHRSSAAQ
jgi:hypothetical protein